MRQKHLKDPGSAITHFIAMLMAIFSATPLLIKAAHKEDPIYVISLAIFIGSMILLYTASTLYHSLDISEKVNKRLKKFDHMMISVLIAGSYTPICLITLKGPVGYTMLAIVWGIAIAGILVKAFWVNCPKWFSSVLYIGMGWTCVIAFTKTSRYNVTRWIWMAFSRRIVYTIGGIIYALKLPLFNNKHKNFGSHEIFHLFVMGGSVCHFIVMYVFLLR